jgi:anti-sigma regulatory factor (Ser/Thr protein kinase)
MEFRADRLQDLARLPAFLDAACAGIDADARGDVRLATEEVFTNIYAHGYRSRSGPVDIRVGRSPGRITVAIADQAPVFDPASAPSADIDSDFDDRSVGGLGWHMVGRVMDEVGWAPGVERGNVYLLVKYVAA